MPRSPSIEEALEEAREEHAAKTRLAEELSHELRSLEIEILGLEMALRRSQDRQPADQVRTRTELTELEREAWNALHRTDAIEAILRGATGPLGPSEVMAALHEKGRDDAYHVVASTLVHLSKRGRVFSVGRGQWLLSQGGDHG